MEEPSFKLPEIIDNDNGWGPSPVMLPEKFRDIPYAPYSKADKLGRIADWSTPEQREKESSGRQRTNYRNYRDQYTAFGHGVSNAFAYAHAEDEASFSVVDNRSTAQKKASSYRTTGGTKGRTSGARGQTNRNVRNGQYQRPNTQTRNTPGGRAAQNAVRKRYGWKDYDKPQRARDASVNVGPDWKVLEEIEFNWLSKLNLDVENLAKDDTATVFATDSVLSLLMCAPRSVYPWDIIINRVENKLFFDKRDTGVYENITVNENSFDPPLETGDKDNINSPSALSMEATLINHYFALQVVNEGEKYELDKPNPFISSQEDNDMLAPTAYRYRKFDISIKEDEDISIVVRTQLDSVVKTSGGDSSLITIRALNEFDPRSQGAGGALDWRQKLDTQRGAVVTTEMKNNSCKLARWAVQSILAGADQMKLGYISRVSPKDNTKHAILGTQIYKPRDFAAQMNLSVSNGWGIVRTVIDLCMKLPEGKYVLIKDPNKPVIRLYAVPANAFEADDDLALEDGEEINEEEEVQK
ncbi:21405_t:CDS:2 [Rhizophagus irregularis]|nr:21405_t:CDS:2 [Rhizophagus irregularis]